MFPRTTEKCKHCSAVVALLCVAGCGTPEIPIAKVSGRVTIDGKPATEGIVYFVPTRGPSAAGAIQSDGSYRLSTRNANDGAVVGRHRVYLGPAWPVDNGSGMVADVKPRAPNTFPPQRYRTPEASGLTAEVSESGSTIDFDLTTR